MIKKLAPGDIDTVRLRSQRTSVVAAVRSLNADTFRWTTRTGKVICLGEMATSHIFNTMKMLFNHLASQYGGDPVKFDFRYSKVTRWARHDPHDTAALVIFFIEEINKRSDLPKEYHLPFMQIWNQIIGIRRLSAMDKEVRLISANG